MPGRSKRGFGAMSPEKQQAIARKGGQAAHRKGTAHEFTPEEARAAGHLGGQTVGANRAHMAAIGRKGGQRAASNHTRSPTPTDQESNNQHSSRSRGPRATDLLRADHRRVNGLFHQYEMSHDRGAVRVSLMQQICAELEMHARLEEELFYPAVKAKVNESVCEKIDNGIKEHQRMKDLIAQMRRMTVDNAFFIPTVEQLRACVEHHIQEEEREALPVAEEQCGEELQELGAQIQQRKQDLMNSAASPPSLEYSEREATSEPSPLHEESVATSH